MELTATQELFLKDHLLVIPQKRLFSRATAAEEASLNVAKSLEEYERQRTRVAASVTRLSKLAAGKETAVRFAKDIQKANAEKDKLNWKKAKELLAEVERNAIDALKAAEQRQAEADQLAAEPAFKTERAALDNDLSCLAEVPGPTARNGEELYKGQLAAVDALATGKQFQTALETVQTLRRGVAKQIAASSAMAAKAILPAAQQLLDATQKTLDQLTAAKVAAEVLQPLRSTWNRLRDKAVEEPKAVVSDLYNLSNQIEAASGVLRDAEQLALEPTYKTERAALDGDLSRLAEVPGETARMGEELYKGQLDTVDALATSKQFRSALEVVQSLRRGVAKQIAASSEGATLAILPEAKKLLDATQKALDQLRAAKVDGAILQPLRTTWKKLYDKAVLEPKVVVPDLNQLVNQIAATKVIHEAGARGEGLAEELADPETRKNALEFEALRKKAQDELTALQKDPCADLVKLLALENLILVSAAKAFQQPVAMNVATALNSLQEYPKQVKEIQTDVVATLKVQQEYNATLKSVRDQLWEVGKLEFADVQEPRTLIDQAVQKVGGMGRPKVAVLTAAIALLKDAANYFDSIKQNATAQAGSVAKELAAMPEYFAQLAKAQQKITELKTKPGTAATVQTLETMLQQAQSLVKPRADNAVLSSGYVPALALLKTGTAAAAAGAGQFVLPAGAKGFDDLCKQAEQEHEEFKKRPTPENVRLAYEAALKSLNHLAGATSPRLAEPFTPKLARLYEQGKEAVDEAARAVVVASLNNAAEDMAAEEMKGTALKGICVALQGELAANLKKLGELGVPASVLAPLQAQQKTADACFTAWDMEQAGKEFVAGKESSRKVLDFFQQHSAAWKADSQKLEELAEVCQLMLGVLVVAASAQGVLAEIRTLQTETARTLEFDKGHGQVALLTAKVEMLRMKLGDGIGPKELKELAAARKLANEQVNKAHSDALAKLQKLEAALSTQGIKSTQATDFHAAVDKIFKGTWGAVLSERPSGAGALVGAAERLTRASQLAVQQLRTTGDLIDNTLKNDRALQGVATQAKTRDDVQALQDKTAQVTKLIEQLQKAGGQDTPFRDRLKSAQALDTREAQGKELAALEKQVTDAIAEKTKDVKAARDQANAGQTEVLKTLKELSKNTDFADYFKSMHEEIADLEVLIQGPDPDLIAHAQKQLARLLERTKTFDPKDKKFAGAEFKAVKAKWEYQATWLGTDTLQEFLPTTYQKLKAELERTLVEVKALPPDQGMAKLNALTKPITDAVVKAGALRTEHNNFATRVKAVKEQYDALKAKTRTRVTQKTSKFAEVLDSRFAEAEAAAKNEGGLPVALAKVEAIAEEIKRLSDAPDPRAALQDQDARAAQEFLALQAMAKHWEATVAGFTKTELVQATAAVSAAGEDGDTDQLHDLEGAVGRAGTLVERYLNVFSWNPAKFIGSDQAPPAAQVKADFAQANVLLEQARQAAARIIANPGGTKVQVRNDLPKVVANYKANVAKLSNALLALTKAITTEAAVGGLEVKVKNAAVAVGKQLRSLREKFAPEAFAGPLKTLSDAQSSKTAKQAAREEGLRALRPLAAMLEGDPLVKSLKKANNPFVPVHAELAQLRTALKNLEINLLASA